MISSFWLWVALPVAVIIAGLLRGAYLSRQADKDQADLTDEATTKVDNLGAKKYVPKRDSHGRFIKRSK